MISKINYYIVWNHYFTNLKRKILLSEGSSKKSPKSGSLSEKAVPLRAPRRAYAPSKQRARKMASSSVEIS